MYKKITVQEFWNKCRTGYVPERCCFLILKNGSQSWGYPMGWDNEKGGFFDHYKQGLCHKQDDIEYVLVKV